MRRAALSALALSAVLLAAPRAHAADPAAAQALFEEGRAAMARGDFAAACAAFEGSRALEAAAGTEYNLALCYEKSGRVASAWATYLGAASTYRATNRADWESRARARADALAPSLPRLTIRVEPPVDKTTVRITRDGAAVVASELDVPIPVDPGHHAIHAAAAGRADFDAEVDVALGERKVVDVTLAPLPPAPAPASTPPRVANDAPPASPPPSPPPSSASRQRIAALGVGGLGLAALAVGITGGLVAMGEHDASMRDCPNDGACPSRAAIQANDAAHDWAAVSTVGFALAAASLATAAVLYFTAPRRVAVVPSGVLARW